MLFFALEISISTHCWILRIVTYRFHLNPVQTTIYIMRFLNIFLHIGFFENSKPHWPMCKYAPQLLLRSTHCLDTNILITTADQLFYWPPPSQNYSILCLVTKSHNYLFQWSFPINNEMRTLTWKRISLRIVVENMDERSHWFVIKFDCPAYLVRLQSWYSV